MLIAGKNLMFGELPMGEAVTRGVRALVVSALLVAGTFNTYVTTFLTQTLPQQLARRWNRQRNSKRARRLSTPWSTR